MTGQRLLTLLFSALVLTGCATAPPRDVELSNQGQEALQAGDSRKAEGLLKEALDANPDNPRALSDLSGLYMEQSRYQEAKPLCERVSAREADYARAAANEEEAAEVARLVQLARERLGAIARGEAEEQALLALTPETPAAAPAPEASTTPLAQEPAPVPVPLVSASRTTTAQASPAYRIQLGAFKSRRNAERLSRRLSEKHGELLREREMQLTEVRGVTKVQIGPYPNAGDASAACRSFATVGFKCIIKRH